MASLHYGARSLPRYNEFIYLAGIAPNEMDRHFNHRGITLRHPPRG